MNRKRIFIFTFLTFLILLTNTTIGFTNTSNKLNLIPYPSHIEFKNTEAFRLQSSFTISIQGIAHNRLYKAASNLLTRLSERTSLYFPKFIVTEADKGDSASFIIICNRAGKVQLGEDETYELTIEPKFIKLKCNTDLGGLHGIETLKQLLNADIKGYFFPSLLIQDSPRFAWRGLGIDVARHFMPLEVIKRNLAAMAMVKFNVLHLHLSDDQGIRFESKLFPKLQGMGSDGMYFTQEQLKEIVAFADDLGIRVVPEFDLPGHSTPWFVGYPELAAQKQDAYLMERTFGLMYPAMDPVKESTYKFLDAFWGEVAKIFPDQYLHAGGDEVNGYWWNANPQIQKFMKKNQIKDNHALLAYFNNRLANIFKKYQKRIIGWDEILQENLDKNTTIQVWRNYSQLESAVRKGYQCYLSNGYYLGGTDLNYYYYTDPIPANSTLTPEERKRVLGGEAFMWGERTSPETIDFRIWPKVMTIAERLWSPADILNIEDFYARMNKVNPQLEEVGLLHIKNYDMMMRRLTRGQDITALKKLVEILSSARGGHFYPSTFFSPHTRITEVIADPIKAREFQAMVKKFLANPQDKLAEPIYALLKEWRDNHGELMKVIDQSPILQDIIPLSNNLRELSITAIEAVDFIRLKKIPSMEWIDKQAQLIQSSKTIHPGVKLEVLPALIELIEAVKK